MACSIQLEDGDIRNYNADAEVVDNRQLSLTQIASRLNIEDDRNVEWDSAEGRDPAKCDKREGADESAGVVETAEGSYSAEPI